MKIKIVRAGLAVGFAMALATGCATTSVRQVYPGEARPVSEIATIVGTTNDTYSIFRPSRERLSFMAVNDENTTPWYSLSPYPTTIQVLPGRHKVDVQFEHVHGVARGPIWVEAKSNRTYRIKVMNPEQRTQRVYFVVEDISAQSLVGGSSEATPENPAP